MKRAREKNGTKTEPMDIPQPQVTPKPYKGPVPPFSILVHPDNQKIWDEKMELINDGIEKYGNYEASFEETTSTTRRKQRPDGEDDPYYNEKCHWRFPLPKNNEKYSWRIDQNPRINPREGEDIPLVLLAIPQQSTDTPMENDYV